ncbi:MAG: hypothetical protein P8M22_04145 [Phycisphaerales bacterium]|nr:hypothetical protein [Phycisphaerales bacterium]
MKITNRWMTCLVLLAIGSLPMVAMAEHRWDDCPPGYECVTIECCPGWNRYCLPICPAP